jgi:phytoene dehydrogenase-like protein
VPARRADRGVHAGPAGLAVTVLEADDIVGGISRTAQYKGTASTSAATASSRSIAPVQALWEEILGEEFLECRGCRASTTTASTSTTR